MLLNIIDAASLSVIGQYEIATPISAFQPVLDNDCIYLPTTDGQILVVDKFSGEKLLDIDVGYRLIASDLSLLHGKLYYLCKIPISQSRSEHYAVCCSDPTSGKQIFQGPLMSGQHAKMTAGRTIVAIVDKQLLFHDETCSILKKVHCNFEPQFTPILASDKIVVASPNGFLGIYANDGVVIKQLILPRTTVHPIEYLSNLLWTQDRNILQIDISSYKTATLVTLASRPTIIRANNGTVICVSPGHVYKISTEGGTRHIEVNNSAKNAIACGNTLFLFNHNSILPVTID